MDWSRAKNILLAVLLAVNLFLLGNLAYMQWSVRSIEREERRDTVQYLAAQGVAVDEDLLPVQKLARSVLIAERDETQEAQAAAALTGGSVQAGSGDSGSTRYEGGTGSVTFRSGGLIDASLTGLSEAAAIFEDSGLSDSGGGKLPEPLLAAGFSTALVGQEGDSYVLTQQYDGLPVFNCRLAVSRASDGGAVLSGRWVLGGAVPIEGESERGLAGLLIEFVQEMRGAGYSVRTVSAVESGYFAEPVSNIGLRLIPVWKITASDVTGYIDACTGTILAAGAAPDASAPNE